MIDQIKQLKIPAFLLYGLAVLALVFLVSASMSNQSSIYCDEVKIKINTGANEKFIQEAVVSNWVNEFIGKGSTKKTIKEISLVDLEEAISNKPYIHKAFAHFDSKGRLSMEVVQDLPILRVIDGMDKSYYITESRKKMPMGPEYTSRVPIVTGHIPVTPSDTIPSKGVLNELYEYGKYIQSNKFLNALSEQIYLRADGDMELIPKVGDFTILLGDSKELEKKENRILSFYKQVLPSKKYQDVKLVNVKFDNQIVCSK